MPIWRGNTIMYLRFSTQCQFTHIVHRCHVLQHFVLSITASAMKQTTSNTTNHAPLAVSNQLCEEGTSRQSWFSHGKLAMASGNDIHYNYHIYYSLREHQTLCTVTIRTAPYTYVCMCVHVEWGWGWQWEITYNATFSFRNYHNCKKARR